MSRTGHRIFGDAQTRGEEAGDEVIFLTWVGDSSRNDRGGFELTDRGEVGAQVPDRALVGEERQQEDLVVSAARPLHRRAECRCHREAGIDRRGG